MSLLGLNVLVTRPAGQADQLLDLIKRAGGNVTHFPVLAISPLDAEQDSHLIQMGRQLIMDLDRFQQIIFISTNAVRFGMQWIFDYWPQLPVGIQWHGIGCSTKTELEKMGVVIALGATQNDEGVMDSEALLEVAALQAIAGQKVVIVRGVQGREQLKSVLTERGAMVSYLECYRRTVPILPLNTLDAIAAASLDVVCINSAESLENLCQLALNVLPILKNKTVLLPSQRVATLAKQHGFKHIDVTDNAGDQAMLKGLLKLIPTHGEARSER